MEPTPYSKTEDASVTPATSSSMEGANPALKEPPTITPPKTVSAFVQETRYSMDKNVYAPHLTTISVENVTNAPRKLPTTSYSEDVTVRVEKPGIQASTNVFLSAPNLNN